MLIYPYMPEQTPTPSNNRILEGPAQLISDHHDEFMLREHHPIHGSFADQLTARYGAEGTGWDFDTEDPRHDMRNQLEHASHHPEFQLANEGWGNVLHGSGRYETDDGIALSGIQRYVRKPDMGNVVLYPDGVEHAGNHSKSD